GKCGLAKRRSFILNSRSIRILGTSISTMSSLFRIAISVAAIAVAAPIVGTTGAFSQASTPAPQAAPAQAPATQVTVPTPPKPVARPPAPAQGAAVTVAPTEGGRTYVYLLRGLMNIFSLGMDDLAAKLQRRGIAAGVYEYGQWESLCQDAAARWHNSRT